MALTGAFVGVAAVVMAAHAGATPDDPAVPPAPVPVVTGPPPVPPVLAEGAGQSQGQFGYIKDLFSNFNNPNDLFNNLFPAPTGPGAIPPTGGVGPIPTDAEGRPIDAGAVRQAFPIGPLPPGVGTVPTDGEGRPIDAGGVGPLPLGAPVPLPPGAPVPLPPGAPVPLPPGAPVPLPPGAPVPLPPEALAPLHTLGPVTPPPIPELPPSA